MNVIDWLTQSAQYMVTNHPALYQNVSDALEELSSALDTLRNTGWEESTLVIGPFIMYRVVQEEVEEVFLSEKVSSMVLFADEGVCRAYGWVPQIDLDDPLDDGLDEC